MKKRIVIGSVLKPVDDIRHYHKIAKSLAKTGDWEIHIVAFQSKKELPEHENIHFHPVFNFKRLSLSRIFAPFKFRRILSQIKPDVMICCTHELLGACLNFKLINRTKLIYDVQESYFHNIIYGKTWSPPLNILLAFRVRIMERLHTRWIDQFWLAERIYNHQLPFIPEKKRVLLENKTLPDLIKVARTNENPREKLQLLICGTLAEEYGSLKAVEVCEELRNKHRFTNFTLKIIGFGAHEAFISKLKSKISGLDWIENVILDQPVPYEQIINSMGACDVVLLPYRFGKSTAGRIPTKLWECLALGKRFVLQNQLFLKQEFGRYTTYHQMDYYVPGSSDQLLKILQDPNEKLVGTEDSSDFFWDEGTLVEAVKRL